MFTPNSLATMNANNVPEKLFEARLQALHALSPSVKGEPAMDTHREEMLAMFDSFLGEDFDGTKKERVIALQQNLHRGQALLARQLEQGVFSAAEYAERVNHLVSTVFEACENLLGAGDFEALFGAPRAEMQGYIDTDAFVASRQQNAAPEKDSIGTNKPERRQAGDQVVLIVDESKLSRVQLRGAFRRAGFRVLAADSGWTALEMLKSHRPDLMVVDIAMPTMSGFELVDIVHKRPKTAKVQVFMMASEITATTRTEAFSVGASDVFIKSAEPEALVSSINRAFEI